ncbi:MAG TPA: ROK family protein [Actinocatenispora sp.]
MASASLISPTSLGVVNRMRVLSALHASGPQSRAEIARAFGVSRATVGTILQPLLDSGVLVESEPVTPSRGGGKPPRPIWFSASARAIGAVEVLPGRVTAARLAPTGEVRHREERRFPLRTKESESFATALAESCAAAFGGYEVIGVGVAAAGLVEPDDGRVVELTAAPALANYPVTRAIAAVTAAPVYLEHHARVQALGDRWFGAGRGLDTFASVSTGDTVGVGIVHHGTVLSAPGAASGAHMTVDVGGIRCDCGKRGCWKTIATTGWLRRRAAELDLPGPRGVTLARLVARGDTTLADEYARNLAVGLGTVQQLLAPGVFILHGDAAAGGPDFLARLTRYLRAESPRRQGEYQPSVVAADPAQDSALLGCAGLVLSRGMDLLR